MEILKKGAFAASLKRNNKQIRQDRAEAISEDAQLIYKREIEDLEKDIRTAKREQDNNLDLSPENTQTLKLATDFKAKDWVATDLKLGVEIRNLEIKLEIARKRYAYLFEGNTDVAAELVSESETVNN
jgi:hypothetical protein